MVKNLRCTGLSGDNDRHIVYHRLKRRYAERFRYAGHDIHVAHGEYTLDFCSLKKAGKVKILPYMELGDPLDHAGHHISGARHDKHDLRKFFQDSCRRLDKILGTLLECNSAEKEIRTKRL